MVDSTKILTPNNIYYRLIGRKLQTLIAVSFGFILMGMTIGVPHIQWTYSYSSTVDGHPTASQKQTAWYLSVTGWQLVSRHEHGPLTFIKFISLMDCFTSDAANVSSQ